MRIPKPLIYMFIQYCAYSNLDKKKEYTPNPKKRKRQDDYSQEFNYSSELDSSEQDYSDERYRFRYENENSSEESYESVIISRAHLDDEGDFDDDIF